MKKIFLSLLLVLFVLTGCSNSKLSSINLDELNEKLNKKETFIIYFSKNDNKLEDTLNNVLNENSLTGYKFDTSKISNEEKNKLELQIAYEEPSIVFVINGLDSSKLSHITNQNTTKKEILARLKDMNFIKEYGQRDTM